MLELISRVSIAKSMLAILSFSLAQLALAEDRFANVVMKASHVSGPVHMLEGAGGNIGVSIGLDGTLIIDDQFAPLADKISAALKELDGDAPRLILNTHYHGDHTGSNPTFGRTGSIVAHDNVRSRLAANAEFPRSGLPVITYSQSATVHFNDDTLSLIHLPKGHTDGDSAVWFKEANVIHMGDHFFNGFFPYIDIDSGGSIDGFIANIENILYLVPDNIQIIPGHGPLANATDLLKAADTIKKSSQQIRQALARGDSVDTIAAQIDKDFPGWGGGFINASRWTQIVQAGTPAAK